MPEGEFSVYYWLSNGRYAAAKKFIDAKSAVDIAASITHSADAITGIINRVIITDGGDCTCFEWIHGQGVVFPKD